MRLWLVPMVIAAMVSGAALNAQTEEPETPEDSPAPKMHPVPKAHTSRDWSQCERCRRAFAGALNHTLRRLPDPVTPAERDEKTPVSYSAKMVCGWLLLAEERHPKELQEVLDLAADWENNIGEHASGNHRRNWYPALAGQLLAERMKYRPDRKTYDALKGLVAFLQKTQEPTTGGWFKWFEGATKDTQYPVKDLGILDATILGFLHTAKAEGIEMPPAMLERAEACMNLIVGGGGISYGTGQNGPDPTGARGGFAMGGLMFDNLKSHRIVKLYTDLLPRNIPAMNKGHHVGGLHCLGVTLGCHLIGEAAYKKLTDCWLDKLLDSQKDDGGFYVGDDADAGGEEGLMGEDDASTASVGLLIMLQDPARLDPTKRPLLNCHSLLIDTPAAEALRPAVRLALQGELDKVFELLDKTTARKGASDAEKTEAKAIAGSITGQVEACVKEAEERLAEGDVATAIEMLGPLAKALKKNAAGQAVQAALDRTKEPAAQRELQAQKALAAAWKMLFTVGRTKATPTFQKLVEDFADTAAAKNAQAMLD